VDFFFEAALGESLFDPDDPRGKHPVLHGARCWASLLFELRRTQKYLAPRDIHNRCADHRE